MATGPATLEIAGLGLTPIVLTRDELVDVGLVEQRSDFHCVTTWTHQGLLWSGVPMASVWEQLIAPRLAEADRVRYVVARGGDAYQTVLRVEDLLAPDVLIATSLDGADLGPRHGTPLRLVCPAQYGYKSVKHLNALELHERQPPTRGRKDHLRARVAFEERHPRLPARLVRVPYRLVIPITAIVAERAAR